MGWAALAGTGLQLYGNYVQGNAAEEEARKQSWLNGRYQQQYGQYSQLGQNDEAFLQNRLHTLSGDNYANADALSQALGSGNRTATGERGVDDSTRRLNDALGAVQTQGPDRSLTGDRGGSAKWGADTTARVHTPVLEARKRMLSQMAGQREMANYDRNAIGRASDNSIDIGRQSAEAQARFNSLAAYRTQRLAQAGVDTQYQGPGANYYNAQLYGGMANLAGSGLQSYGANQQHQPRAR